MSIDPNNIAQIRERERRVWDLLLQGLEGVEIARREGVDPAVISRIKTRVERRLVEETEGKAATFRARQIAEIRRVRREAWRGWEASCKPAAKTTRRSTARGAGLVEASEIKGQSGNPAFLATVFEGLRLEARLTGTETAVHQRLDGKLRVETNLVALLQAGRQRVAALKRARDGQGD
jgi:hypothetical protein